MKRIISLFLILAIAFTLASCSNQTGGTSSTTSDTEKESSQMISSSESISSSQSESSNSTSSSQSTNSQTASSTPSSTSGEQEPINTGILKFHAISCIERGDALLIQTTWGKNILVDAGKKVSGDQVVGYLKNQGIKKIDALIATHYHEDHTGGMGAVMDNFPIGKLYVPNIDLTRAAWGTLDYNNFRNSYRNRDIEVGHLSAGSKLDLDSLVKIDILAPEKPFYDFAGQRFENDINNNLSIVMKVTYDEVSFLLMGDALFDCENTMMAAGYDLKADVLKTGHHGNLTSTGTEFLDAVQPKYGLSCREVPYPQVAPRLQAVGAESLDTSSQNIIFTTNGKTLTVATTPRATYN